MPSHPDEGHWTAYNVAQLGRRPRSLNLRALELAGPGDGRVAVELGSGSGVDARFLQSNGWDVYSYDSDPESAGGVQHMVTDLAALHDLPRADLVLSNATLSFLGEADLRRLLTLAGERLAPGGVFAADFWGPHDDWASGPGAYPDRATLGSWLPWLEAAAADGEEAADPVIHEQERNGRSFAGPKHWHVLTVLGRRSP